MKLPRCDTTHIDQRNELHFIRPSRRERVRQLSGCSERDHKLKNCTAYRLVKYCGVDCQKAHRKQHKKACKQRAAELKDERLYSQGHERPEGDFCPICTLLIPLRMDDHSHPTHAA